MPLVVNHALALRHPFDADRVVPCVRAAFAGTEVEVTVRRSSAEPNRIPEWVAVGFSASHGDYHGLVATTKRLLTGAGLIGELKAAEV